MRVSTVQHCGHLVILLVVACFIVACDDLTKEEQAKIDSWLLCDECTAGELDSVVALGNRAVSHLSDALRGPATVHRENVARQISTRYVAEPGGISEDDYVVRLLQNYVALYQSRAAQALAAIGTATARTELETALDSATVRGYRSDVLRILHSAIARSKFSSFTGSLGDTSVAFGDTVDVYRNGGLQWNGNENVILNGGPFPDDVFLARRPDTLQFLAIGYLGSYDVSITNLGPNEIVEIAPLRITSLRYNTHSPTTAPLVLPTSLPQRFYLALGTRSDDTTDYFKFSPIAPTPITTTVESPGFDVPSLQWQECATQTTPFPGPTLSGVVTDNRGVGVSDARIDILGTSIFGTTDPNGRFNLGTIPAPTSPGVVRVRVTKTGFRQVVRQIQLGVANVRIGLVESEATEARARSEGAVSIIAPGGQCLLLEVASPRAGGPQIVRLRLTSP